jgi:hypothetical protein
VTRRSGPLPVDSWYDEPALFPRPEPVYVPREYGFRCEGCSWVVDRAQLELDTEGQLWLCAECR